MSLLLGLALLIGAPVLGTGCNSGNQEIPLAKVAPPPPAPESAKAKAPAKGGSPAELQYPPPK